jgi:hypothetical protein
MLKTIAGILTAMCKNDVENKELLKMSGRCIDLQMALNKGEAVGNA